LQLIKVIWQEEEVGTHVKKEQSTETKNTDSEANFIDSGF
jgi:hypothetical protein